MKKSLLRNMVLGDFKAAGALPEMVQVGNEITNGMIWPLGKLPPAVNGKTLASFVASGLKAVHDTDAGIKTMIHIDKGGDNAASRTFYDQLINTNGVKDFDVIGLSYYPFWHGNMQQMQANINDLAARYGKDVVIVETAFGYTNENFDDTKNPYDAQAERVGGFRSTVQGQATGLRTVMQSLANVPGGKGIGMFYWEPDWYAVPGAGAFKDKGDEWDNLVMFDNSGKALESWKVFTDVSDQSLPTIAPKFKEADGVTAEAGVGAAVEDDARDVHGRPRGGYRDRLGDARARLRCGRHVHGQGHGHGGRREAPRQGICQGRQEEQPHQERRF